MNDDGYTTTNQVMADKHFNAPLGMLTTPYDPIKVVRPPRFRLDRYTLLRAIHQLGMLVLMTVLCIATYLLISNYFIKSVKVVGSSMSPTLQEGGQYLLDRFSLLSREPRRDEIVVIRDPGAPGALAVKRVIALAGESIFFKDGFVYVNGKKLDEPFLLPRTMTFTYASANEQFITCGKDQYFVLGDNRTRSIDSRSYGPVSRKDVLGLIKLK